MNIILTNHSKQRREHLPVTEDEHLLNWINYFIEKFNMEKLEDKIYKIHSGGNTAILRKDGDKLIAITFRGFKDFDIRESLNIHCKVQEERVFFNTFKNASRPAGEITWEGNSPTVVFKDKIFEKYDIPVFGVKQTFKSSKELRNVFNLVDNKWILKDFPLRNGKSIVMRENFKGVMQECGSVKNGVLSLNSDLEYKFDINFDSYKGVEKDNNRFIHFNEKLGTWMLNDFPRKDYVNDIKPVMRKNEKGELVKCGTFHEGKLKLSRGLQNKYDIDFWWTYKGGDEENDRFIHFNEDSSCWMLNDFPKRTKDLDKINNKKKKNRNNTKISNDI